MLEESEEDELMPRPAFHIDDENENLTEEEKEAFQYIKYVRLQKQKITKHKVLA
jgi:hypothetical protein